jgi:hypothetical protein
MTLATTPYACPQVSARSGVHGMPEELLQGGQQASPNRRCSAQSSPRSDGDHGPVAEEGHHVVEPRRRFETTRHRAATSLSRCDKRRVRVGSQSEEYAALITRANACKLTPLILGVIDFYSPTTSASSRWARAYGLVSLSSFLTT